jgi:Ca2+-binding EF-hand superfamily protein
MGGDENNQEINEKIMIILSIKIEEMEKKLKVLTDPYYSPNIFTVFNEISAEGIGYEEFRTGILTIITNIKEKIRISEDDIKSLFYLLDDKSRGYIIEDSIERLKNLEEMG